MPGSEPSPIVIGDSDGLIALLNENDRNFARARLTIQDLVQQRTRVIFPATTIAETVTTLQRKLAQPQLAAEVIQRVTSGAVEIDNVDYDLLRQATDLFDPDGSKQNTLFDAIVAAMAYRHQTRTIFSFDHWYRKLGFTLSTDE